MKAIESWWAVAAARKAWRRAFAVGACVFEEAHRQVLWHRDLGLWGLFGDGAENEPRCYSHAFGQVPFGFRARTLVQINIPAEGCSARFQGLLAADDAGRRWVLRRGRMTTPGKRMTETEFVAASGLKPVEVEFSTGASALCLAVAPIDDAPEALQECLAAFVANCARARLPRHASPATRNAVGDALEWERGLAPALHGGFFIEARDETVERRLHGEILQGLERALKARGIACVAERVGAYGPDLFTWHDPRALFSIRSRATAADVFEGVGQLQIYERLLGNGYRKVLVMPDLPAEPMARMLGALNVRMLGFRWRGRAVRFDPEALETCLGA